MKDNNKGKINNNFIINRKTIKQLYVAQKRDYKWEVSGCIKLHFDNNNNNNNEDEIIMETSQNEGNSAVMGNCKDIEFHTHDESSYNIELAKRKSSWQGKLSPPSKEDLIVPIQQNIKNPVMVVTREGLYIYKPKKILRIQSNTKELMNYIMFVYNIWIWFDYKKGLSPNQKQEIKKEQWQDCFNTKKILLFFEKEMKEHTIKSWLTILDLLQYHRKFCLHNQKENVYIPLWNDLQS